MGVLISGGIEVAIMMNIKIVENDVFGEVRTRVTPRTDTNAARLGGIVHAPAQFTVLDRNMMIALADVDAARFAFHLPDDDV